ncbi:MAG TPA: patatin-like phospholipase family protein [Luteibacter sp.]|nr:patatin-like phospholipase family protein [Luteibacter sp.]
MSRRRLVLVWLIGLAAIMAQPAPEAHAQDANLACRIRPVVPENRPRIGLVLGGGGARGIAHIAVLRKLEQLHIPVDCIAGTSMGALVGALYASGMSVDDIEKLVLSLDWDRLFNDSLDRRDRSYRRKTDDTLVVSSPGIGIGPKGIVVTSGLLAGERILLLFEKMVEPVGTIEDFDDLPIPYRAVAADINTGEALVIGEGDLALAMRASMSIPGVFPPVRIGDHVVVDGGVARNIPIDVARKLGADIVIAVDVGTPLGTVTPQSNVLAITGQVTGLLTVRNTQEQLATLTERDVLISPPLGNKVGTSSFTKGKEALAIGKEGADTAGPALSRLTVSDDAYAQNVSMRHGRQSPPPVIQFVRLDNRSRYRDSFLTSRIDIPVGQPFDAQRAENSLYRVYGLNTLSQVTYELVKENGQDGVIVHVNEKLQGPNYLEAGLSTSGDFNGRFDLSVRLGILRSPVNDTGGEVRVLASLGDETGLLTEYYQPLGKTGKYFFAGRADYLSYQINTFDAQGHKTAEYDARKAGIGLGFGREFGNYGALTAGIRRDAGDVRIHIGDPSQPRQHFQTGEVYLEGTLDRLDSFYFPRDGYYARTRYTWSRDALGADTEYEQFDFDALDAILFGKHSVQVGLRYHVTTQGVAPIQSVYRLGGFSRLVGFQPNELTGQDYGVLMLGYSYRIGRILNQDALVGSTLEYGNAWPGRSQMSWSNSLLNGSIYLGLNSWIGPILFGIGGRQGGDYNVFLEIGHRF